MPGDEDKTQPGANGDEPTHPGGATAEELAFDAVASTVDRVVAALRSRARLGIGRGDEARHRSLWHLALAAGEAADHLHDLRRVALALMREEEARKPKGIP